LPRAGGMKRVLAIVVDWFVVGIISTAIVPVAHEWSSLYGWVLFLLLDVVLTAFYGQTPGRYVARLRVVSVRGGGPPGLWPALLRTTLVLISGWLGLFVYLLSLRYADRAPRRMWWDAAAGTQLVSAA
jgi:RDD family